MKIYLVIGSLLISISLIANDSINNVFRSAVDTLVSLRKSMLECDNDIDLEVLNHVFEENWIELLSNEQAFDYNFDSIPKIGSIRSDDGEIRIITWNLPLSNETQKYYCFVLRNRTKDRRYNYYRLQDKSDEIYSPYNKVLKHDKWFGALYYKIITHGKKKNNEYILLGWDGNNMMSNKKIIDIMYFPKKGGPKFGAGIFKMEKGTYKRVIFEYNNDAVMTLTYDQKEKAIFFDQLAPQNPELKGFYEYYVPSMKFDALYFKGNRWLLTKDVDIRQKKNYLPYNPPK